MKFGGTQKGTQGTLGHQLLYFPSKTTDRNSVRNSTSSSLNKYMKTFKLLKFNVYRKKQETTCNDVLVNWIHSLLQPLVVRKTLFVCIRLTLFSFYEL